MASEGQPPSVCLRPAQDFVAGARRAMSREITVPFGRLPSPAEEA